MGKRISVKQMKEGPYWVLPQYQPEHIKHQNLSKPAPKVKDLKWLAKILTPKKS